MSSENIFNAFNALFITVFCNLLIGWVSPEYSGKVAEFQSRFISSKKSGCEIFTLSDDDQLIFGLISRLMEKGNSELETNKRKNPAEMKLMQCLDFFSKKENATISFTPVKAKKAISVPNTTDMSTGESQMKQTNPNPVTVRPLRDFKAGGGGAGSTLLSALRDKQSAKESLSTLLALSSLMTTDPVLAGRIIVALNGM